jgi:lipoate-protein ligase A
MARDEALLDRCDRAEADVVLRFYAWQAPTISLGYFQDFDEFLAQPQRISSLAVVRRTTGGGAILHDAEVTYSLVLPVDHPLVAGRPNELYRMAHRAILSAIGNGASMLETTGGTCDSSSQRGPFYCFARRHHLDVVVADGAGGFEKIAGSAQRRTRSAILQHGSIILESRFAEQAAASWSARVGTAVRYEDAVARLVSSFGENMGIDPQPGQWTPDELVSASRFEEMYESEAWTQRRERIGSGPGRQTAKPFP